MPSIRFVRLLPALCLLFVSGALFVHTARADETCQSPYLPRLVGQEDFIYVWTLGIEGVGDGSDKLVTVGANPILEGYGKIVSSVSVGGRHEAHHGGPTDDRRHLWVGGLDDSYIFIFDIASDPAHPKLVRTLTDFPEKTGGVVGPHGFYALPGRMLISALSNAKDASGRTALVEYNHEGEFIRTIWMPEDAPYGYDARIKPELNRMLTSSFTGKSNYMRKLPELLNDAAAMKNFGDTMVIWDYHARKPLQVLKVPGAPLEIRWALVPEHHYAFTATALTSKLVGVFRKDDGSFEAVELADIGDPSKTPLPVDISLSADDKHLFVDSFMDGMVRVFDVSQPRAPKQIYEKKIGPQVNMVSQSWDGKRLYFTTSLLGNWDGVGGDDAQFLKAFDWDGKQLTPRFEIDFRKEKIGRPHIMNFGQKGLYKAQAQPGGAPGEPG
jgi:selenium-binding protein 1